MKKNREKGTPRFANINFVGRCNAHCFFCIGNEANDKINCFFDKHFKDFENLEDFLEECKKNEIYKLYLTGLDSEPTLYPYLKEFVEYLKNKGFTVGLRTNGLRSVDYTIFNDEISVSIHSLNEETNKRIGINTLNFEILRERLKGTNHRYSIVVNRYNVNEIENLIYILSEDKEASYIQIRQICTDNLDCVYEEDNKAFEKIERYITDKYSNQFLTIFDGCKVYKINGVNVCIWKPMSNETNSWNYFIDGKISKSYFVLESYNETIL